MMVNAKMSGDPVKGPSSLCTDDERISPITFGYLCSHLPYEDLSFLVAEVGAGNGNFSSRW